MTDLYRKEVADPMNPQPGQVWRAAGSHLGDITITHCDNGMLGYRLHSGQPELTSMTAWAAWVKMFEPVRVGYAFPMSEKAAKATDKYMWGADCATPVSPSWSSDEWEKAHLENEIVDLENEMAEMENDIFDLETDADELMVENASLKAQLEATQELLTTWRKAALTGDVKGIVRMLTNDMIDFLLAETEQDEDEDEGDETLACSCGREKAETEETLYLIKYKDGRYWGYGGLTGYSRDAHLYSGGQAAEALLGLPESTLVLATPELLGQEKA